MDEPNDPLRPATLVWAAVVFYGLMAVVGLVVMVIGDVPLGPTIFGVTPGAEPPNVLVHVLIGAGAGLGVVFLTWLVRGLKPMQHLKDEFASVLGQQSSVAIAILAITSAVGEELLFRGALQPLIGFWPTAIIFGVLHGGHDPKLWGWAIFAVLAGILLGWLASYTGSLLAPILAHLTVNYWNLHALVADSPNRPQRSGARDSR